VCRALFAVSTFGADAGLFVSWGGLKSNVPKERAAVFPRAAMDAERTAGTPLRPLQSPRKDLKAELPLKRIWTVAAQNVA